MNKELLANIRNILIPTLASQLKKTNYEGQGEKDAIEFTHDMTEIFDLAEQQLSAQPGWIPCSAALPDDDTEVIVSCTDDSGDDEFSYVTTGWHYKGLWVVNNDRCYFVKAWQPLPEAWKGEEHGTPRAVLSQKPVR